jgi:hypothetical protein
MLTLEKGTTSRPTWLSDQDLTLLNRIRDIVSPMKPVSDSFILRIFFRSNAHRILSGKSSLKQLVSEATETTEGTENTEIAAGANGGGR